MSCRRISVSQVVLNRSGSEIGTYESHTDHLEEVITTARDLGDSESMSAGQLGVRFREEELCHPDDASNGCPEFV
jgi:hypothetical protein